MSAVPGNGTETPPNSDMEIAHDPDHLRLFIYPRFCIRMFREVLFTAVKTAAAFYCIIAGPLSLPVMPHPGVGESSPAGWRSGLTPGATLCMWADALKGLG